MPIPRLDACRSMHTSRNEAPQSVSFESHSIASKLASFAVTGKWMPVLEVSTVVSRSYSTWKRHLTQSVETSCFML